MDTIIQTNAFQYMIHSICEAYNVQSTLIKAGQETNLEQLDWSFRRNSDPAYDYRTLKEFLTKGITQDTIHDVEDRFRLHYIVFLLSKEERKTFYILGPFLGIEPGSESFEYPTGWEHFSDQFRTNLTTYYNTVPLIQDLDAWHRMLKSSVKGYCGHELTMKVLMNGQSPLELENADISALQPDVSASYDLMEMRYACEQELMDAISAADTEHALTLGKRMRQNFKINRKNIQLQKDLIITSNTLFRKAAQKAFVAPLYMDALSTRMIQETEACNDSMQLDFLFMNMIRKYCMLVHSYSRVNYPVLIRRVMGYIDCHYSEKITLCVIAEHFSVSKNYLSSLFHKSVGTTLTEYINQIRLQQALRLLNTSDSSIQSISEQCGFTDTNYFTRTYKKIYGITPQEYRKMIGQTHSTRMS